MTTYYRVQKAASGVREFLTGAMSLPAAQAHLNSIVRNLLANGYLKSDRDTFRKLPVVILGLNGNTVALSVVECTADDLVETRRELAEMPWLVRTFDLSDDADTRELAVANADETPSDGLFDYLEEGINDYADYEDQNARSA